MRRSVVVAVTLTAGLALVGCGGDDDDGGDGATEAGAGGSATTTAADENQEGAETTVENVTLAATVRLDGRLVNFDYTLTNAGTEPVAVVDPAAVAEQVDMLDEGSFRASWVRSEVYGEGGGPLPFLRGKIVVAGAELEATAGISGEWDELPSVVQLCIEVVPQPWTDKGDGVAEFPYRPRGAAPTLVCTDELDVPTG